MWKTRIAVLFFIVKIETKLTPLSTGDVNARLSLSQCVIWAMDRFLIDDYKTVTYSLPLADKSASPVTLESFLLRSLNRLQAAGVLIKNFNGKTLARNRRNQSRRFIVHFTSQEDLNAQLTALKRRRMFNPHAKFLLISTKIFDNPHRMASDVSAYLWRENVINSVILLVNPQNVTHSIVFAWNPFERGRCDRSSNATARTFDSCEFGISKKNFDWFGNKVPKKFTNCSIKVKYANSPPYSYKENTIRGIEVNILEIIGNKLNLQFSYREGGDATSVGELMDLEDKSVDMAIGGYPEEYTWRIRFDVSPSYTQDSIILCAPNVPSIGDFEYMLTFVEVKCVLILLLTHVILTCLIYYTSRGDGRESYAYKRYFHVYFHGFGVLTGGNMPVVAKTRKVRYFLLLHLLLAFFFLAELNSYFVSFSARKTYKQLYSTVYDVDRDDLKVYISIFFQNFVQDETFNRLKKKSENCVDLNSCLRRVTVDRDSVVYMTKLFKYFIVNKNAVRYLYCLRGGQIHYPVNLIMRKGFPMFDRFNEILNMIVSAGFITKWEREFQDRFQDVDHVFTISLRNMWPPIQLCCVLWCAASLVFLVELYVGHSDKKN